MKHLAWLLLLGGCAARPAARALGAGGPRQPSPVTALAFTPDGRLLLSGDAKGVARIWDSDSGELIREMPALPSRVADLIVSPDGSRAAVLSGDEAIAILPLRQDLPARVLRAGHAIHTASFLPDGSGLVTGGAGSRVELWNTATGEARWMTDESLFPVKRVLVSPDARIVACLVRGGKLSFRDAGDGSLLFSAPGILPPESRVGFLPDSRLAIYNPTAYAWNTGTWKREELDPWTVEPWRLPLSRRSVATVVTVRAPHVPRRAWPDFGVPDGVAANAFLNRAAVAGPGGIIRIYDADSREERHGRFPGGAVVIAVSPDGRHIAARAQEDHRVRLWDVARSDRPTWLSVPEVSDLQLAFDPEGRILSAAGRGFFHEWDVRPEPYEDDASRRASADRSHPVALSADGRIRWEIPPDGTIRRRRSDNFTQWYEVPPSRRGIHRVFSSPDGRHALAVDLDGKLLKVDDGEDWGRALRKTVTFRTKVALLDQGTLALFLGPDGVVEVFGLEGERLIERVRPALPKVVALAPFHAGTRYALGDADGGVFLCDAASGLIAPLKSHRAGVLALAVSADGLTLVSSSADESLLIHRLPP